MIFNPGKFQAMKLDKQSMYFHERLKRYNLKIKKSLSYYMLFVRYKPYKVTTRTYWITYPKVNKIKTIVVL